MAELNRDIFRRIILTLNYPLLDTKLKSYFIADISGNDSIAALIKIVEECPDVIIIPSIIELACEYGDKTQYYRTVKELKNTFNKKSRRIMPAIISEANDFWQIMVANNIHDSVKSYGFYSPCIACHLVLHMIRIKIAKHLRIKNVISGERELHSNREKINQLDFVLNFYDSIYSLMGLKHHLPIRYVNETKEIEKIVRKSNVSPINLHCLFSGNYYKNKTCELAIDKTDINNYVKKHLPKLLGKYDKKPVVIGRVMS